MNALLRRLFPLGFFAAVGCGAPSPPVDAARAAPLPPASQPVQRDATGTAPALAPSARAAREAAVYAVLAGRVSLPSENGEAADWRVTSLSVESAKGTSLADARARYQTIESEMGACYRRLGATSRKGKATAIVRLDANGQPMRVEWTSGTSRNWAPEIYACAAETLLASPLGPSGQEASLRVTIELDDR